MKHLFLVMFFSFFLFSCNEAVEDILESQDTISSQSTFNKVIKDKDVNKINCGMCPPESVTMNPMREYPLLNLINGQVVTTAYSLRWNTTATRYNSTTITPSNVVISVHSGEVTSYSVTVPNTGAFTIPYINGATSYRITFTITGYDLYFVEKGLF